ncbi:MAG: hypothetical protein AB7P76_09205 [Candidatus Melainabacteria bacterium]
MNVRRTSLLLIAATAGAVLCAACSAESIIKMPPAQMMAVAPEASKTPPSPAVSSAETRLTAFEDKLAALSTSQPGVIPAAVKAYKSLFSARDPVGLRDEALVGLMDFTDGVVKTLQEQDVLGAMPVSDKTMAEARAEYEPQGLAVETSEGMAYVIANPAWLRKQLQGAITPAWDQYLALRAHDAKAQFAEDGAIAVPWEELRTRYLAWEGFLKTYPAFPMADEARDTKKAYLMHYLVGMNNTPIDDWETHKLRAEVKTSYEKFIANNKQSAAYPLVRDFYQLLKDSRFTVGNATHAFLVTKQIVPPEEP